jgi:hypothetical protein
MRTDQATEQLGRNAHADADEDEQKDGEVILEVHDEAFAERSVNETLREEQYRIVQSWLRAYQSGSYD